MKTLEPLATSELVEQVNHLSKTQTVEARSVTIDFEDLAQIEQGKKRQIPTVYGILILQRPEKIRLLLQAPLVKSNIADMLSDGTHFKIAIFWPDSIRAFLTGSNSVAYQKLASGHSGNPDVKRAGAIKNVRPQHLIEALFLDPIDLDDPGLISFREDESVIEKDTRPGHAKEAMVEKTYCVITLVRKTGLQPARLLKKYWFDRTQAGLPLTRQQIYHPEGSMMTDIRYSEFFSVFGQKLPRMTVINRRFDEYTITIELDPASTRVNAPVAQTAFELENTEGLPVVDLDRRTAGK